MPGMTRGMVTDDGGIWGLVALRFGLLQLGIKRLWS